MVKTACSPISYWVGNLGSVPTGSQQTGFLNALKDSPARYPFIETPFRSYCNVISEMCFCSVVAVGYVHLGFYQLMISSLLAQQDFSPHVRSRKATSLGFSYSSSFVSSTHNKGL